MTIRAVTKNAFARGLFQPFDIYLADGRVLPVTTPEFLAVPAPGRTSASGAPTNNRDCRSTPRNQSEAATKRRGALAAVAAAIVGSPTTRRRSSREHLADHDDGRRADEHDKNAGEDEEHQREDQLHGCLRGFFFRDLPAADAASNRFARAGPGRPTSRTCRLE